MSGNETYFGHQKVEITKEHIPTWVEKIIDRFLDSRVIINCEKDPYLKRWYLRRKPNLAIFIHKFIRSDEDRALHDHPWDFIVIPIWRGYVEFNDEGSRRVWPIISSVRRSAEYRHRVELIKRKPAWSIFIRLKRRRMWGFWPENVFVDWQRWWSDQCED